MCTLLYTELRVHRKELSSEDERGRKEQSEINQAGRYIRERVYGKVCCHHSPRLIFRRMDGRTDLGLDGQE
jgi:hypothetical protein